MAPSPSHQNTISTSSLLFTMHNILVSAALVASATLSLAAPAEVVGRKAFSVQQKPHGKVLRNGPIQLNKAYQKYAKVGAVAPTEVAAAAAAAVQTGSVRATPEQYDEAYLCPVTVGGRVLNLDFDTGSSDL